MHLVAETRTNVNENVTPLLAGRPLKNPIEGKYYDWPVGFHAGLNLADYWDLEEHKLGETSFTH